MVYHKEASLTRMSAAESDRHSGISFEVDHVSELTREIIRDELRIFASEHLSEFQEEMRDFMYQVQPPLPSDGDVQASCCQTTHKRRNSWSPRSTRGSPLLLQNGRRGCKTRVRVPSLVEEVNTPARSGVAMPYADMPTSVSDPRSNGLRFLADSENGDACCDTVGEAAAFQRSAIIEDTVIQDHNQDDRGINEIRNNSSLAVPGSFSLSDYPSVGYEKSNSVRSLAGGNACMELAVRQSKCSLGESSTVVDARSSQAESTRRGSHAESNGTGKPRTASLRSFDSYVEFKKDTESSSSDEEKTNCDLSRDPGSRGSLGRPRHIGSMSKAMFKADIPTMSLKQKRKLLRLVNHPVFDYVVVSMILSNGLLVGIQTDWNARHVSDKAPLPFQVLEIIFCIAFTLELCLRLVAYRCSFFTMSSRWWNIFDFFVVSAQLFEIFMSIVAAGLGFSFNLLRILRLIRVIRLARALRLIGDLRTIVSSIAGSFRPLFWTCVLLAMFVYVLGVYFTQVVLNRRLTIKDEGKEAPGDLEKYWGSLAKAVFSLYCSITGGIDWEVAARPLMDHVSPEMGLIYVLYITFTVFAMLNVVTGVFIESVMKHANSENELRTMHNVQQLFKMLDIDNKGEITWDDFEMSLHKPEMMAFFKTIDVDISHAKNLFEVLDVDGSGCINADEFMDGCLRIWSPSKGLDLRVLVRDVNRVAALVEKSNSYHHLLSDRKARNSGSDKHVSVQVSADDSIVMVDPVPNASKQEAITQESEQDPHRHAKMLT